MRVPTIVVAGTQSGVGKTSVALGLARAFRDRGLRVQTFKVGPDFLDPTHLARASGRPCYNLDDWMMGPQYVQALFARTTADADIAVIEGVMGLFDGAGPAGNCGSTAAIAALLQAPVILVCNVHGMARSFAALVSGYAGFASDVKLCGVVGNRAGSERHRDILAAALAASGLPPLLGAVPREGLPKLPSRHLGLIGSNESGCEEQYQELAVAMGQHLDLDNILELCAAVPELKIGLRPTLERRFAVRVGVALDRAFYFYYQDLFDALRAYGCQLEFFSPLQDAALPAGLDAVIIGGGYPEEYAEQLAANLRMLAAIREFASSGRPLYAECGGLLYLTLGIESGPKFVGALPLHARMLPRRRALGYAQVQLQAKTLWGEPGALLRGHEFHYSELSADPAGVGWQPHYQISKPWGEQVLAEGYGQGQVLASYVHLHLASNPLALESFLATAQNRKNNE